MKLATTEKARQFATIVIETMPINSKLEKADDLPGLPCFISAAWDLKAERCVDQRLSYGGTLAKATLKAVNILLKPSAGSNCNQNGSHLSRYYWYHGIRHEVCAIHNGRVWLRPFVSKQPGANASPRDVPRTDRDTLIRWLSASTTGPAKPFHGPSRSSFAQQPEEIKSLIGSHAELMFYGRYLSKNEVSRMLQSQIRTMNQFRPDDDQYKVPALKTMCLFIDEYFSYSLRRGFAAKRLPVACRAHECTRPFEKKAITTIKQLKDKLHQ